MPHTGSLRSHGSHRLRAPWAPELTMPARRSLRLLNVSEIAEVAGVSPATVSAGLNAAGIAPAEVIGKRKTFDAPQALRTLLSPDSLDPAKERAKLDAAKREMLELQISEKRRSLVPSADVDHGYIALATTTSALMLSIPSAIALELASEADPSKCQDILEKAIHAALTDLAEAGRRAVARIDAEEAAERLDAGDG